MKKITPYRTLQGALNALDNGGRFYNVFTKAKDDVITDAELCRAAGVYSGKHKAFLFFELALSNLSETEKSQVLQCLSPELRTSYLEAKPKQTQIDSFEKQAAETDTVVVSGFPVFLENKTQFSGFIMIPITTGKITTFTMIPIIDQFDIYEVYKTPNLQGEKTIIATVRGSRKLSVKKATFGGVVKKIQFKDKSKKKHCLYVETLFYKTD